MSQTDQATFVMQSDHTALTHQISGQLNEEKISTWRNFSQRPKTSQNKNNKNFFARPVL